MKKILSLATVCLMVATVLTGCKKTEEPAKEVELNLSVAASGVGIGHTLKFTVASEVAPSNDLVINVVSSNTEAATVPATVTMKAGEKSVEGDITALKVGETTVTISADGVKINTGSVKVTVSEEQPEPEPEAIEHKNVEVDATDGDTWQYYNLTENKLVGSGAENETDNAAWAARTDWDIAFKKYKIRTNSGAASSTDAKGGVYTFAETEKYESINALPADAVFATDEAVTEEGMGGVTTTVISPATVILFKLDEEGDKLMPPVYLQAPVYAFRSADGTKVFKTLFTQYKDADNVTGKIMFDYKELK